MTIIVENANHANLSITAKNAEMEAENFYGNIEREENILYRIEKLYEVCGYILSRAWSVEAVKNVAVESEAFTDEEINLIEQAHLIHMSEDSTHHDKMAVIRWIQKVSGAKKMGYNNADYDNVVEKLFNIIRFN